MIIIENDTRTHQSVRHIFIERLGERIAEVVNEGGEDELAEFIFKIVGLDKTMDIIDKIEHIKFIKRR